MKKTLLKNISLFVALIGFSSAQLMAQTTIINENFASAAYSGATDPLDLNTTTGTIWISGHNTGSNKWQIDAAGTPANVWTGANFTWAVHNTPIIVVSGDRVTITMEVSGAGAAGFAGANNFMIAGLAKTKVLADIKTSIGGTRDAMIFATANAGVDLNLTASGAGATTPASTIVAGPLNNIYEIIIEYTIGADAATTVKKARLKNITSGTTSDVGEVTGINADIYTALTTTGAYYLNWAQNVVNSGLTRLKLSKLTVVKNPTVILGVKDFNKASIAANVSPNPVSSILNIGGDVVTKKYRVVNLAGTTVIETAATGSIDVSNLANGVYFLVTDAGIAKFIKE